LGSLNLFIGKIYTEFGHMCEVEKYGITNFCIFPVYKVSF